MASLATIYKQVEREGARWGLFPVIKDGRVKICEMVFELPPHSRGSTTVPHRSPRVVCSLDEQSPLDAFAMVLRHRLQRQHHDFMRMVRARAARLRAMQMREMEDRRRDLRARIERKVIRGQIMSLPR